MKPVFGEVSVRFFWMWGGWFGWLGGWVKSIDTRPPVCTVTPTLTIPHPLPPNTPYTQPVTQGVVYDSDPKKRNLQMQRTANALKSNRLRTYVEKITKARTFWCPVAVGRVAVCLKW